MTKADVATNAKWEAESDLRTLIDAEKIKRDKKKFSAAMKMAKEQKAALAEIQEASNG